jgi:hypothetical protein
MRPNTARHFQSEARASVGQHRDGAQPKPKKAFQSPGVHIAGR